MLVLQRSRSWAEKASRGAGFALTNMKRKDNPSPEPVTFTLNFRQAQHLESSSCTVLSYLHILELSAIAQLVGELVPLASDRATAPSNLH